jgi:hypothetical protein
MRWWRLHQRFGGYLAIFALWVQLAASFAHFHPYSFRPLAAAPSGLGSTAQLPVTGLPGVPPDQPGKSFPRDNCPICATNYLMSSALTGHPPALAGPIVFRHVCWEPVDAGDIPRICNFSSRARAPPIA